jgi:hypothetical protein
MNDVFTWPVGRGKHLAARDGSPIRAPALPVLAYAAAATVAGATVGLLLGLAGAAFGRLLGETGGEALIVLVVVASVIAVLSELGGSASLLPHRRAQVPRRWLLWRRREATAIGFGLLIGSGVLTPIRFASAYVLAAIVALAPAPYLAAIVGAVYGAARGSALAITWLVDTLGHRRLPWDALAANRHMRTAVAVAATVCLASVLVLGGT